MLYSRDTFDISAHYKRFRKHNFRWRMELSSRGGSILVSNASSLFSWLRMLKQANKTTTEKGRSGKDERHRDWNWPVSADTNFSWSVLIPTPLLFVFTPAVFFLYFFMQDWINQIQVKMLKQSGVRLWRTALSKTKLCDTRLCHLWHTSVYVVLGKDPPCATPNYANLLNSQHSTSRVF